MNAVVFHSAQQIHRVATQLEIIPASATLGIIELGIFVKVK